MHGVVGNHGAGITFSLSEEMMTQDYNTSSLGVSHWPSPYLYRRENIIISSHKFEGERGCVKYWQCLPISILIPYSALQYLISNSIRISNLYYIWQHSRDCKLSCRRYTEEYLKHLRQTYLISYTFDEYAMSQVVHYGRGQAIFVRTYNFILDGSPLQGLTGWAPRQGVWSLSNWDSRYADW